jgi:hypothetical protein
VRDRALSAEALCTLTIEEEEEGDEISRKEGGQLSFSMLTMSSLPQHALLLQLERDRAIVEEDMGASTAEGEEVEEGGKQDGSGETGGGQLSWNYAEFRVKYASLAKEVRIPSKAPFVCIGLHIFIEYCFAYV